MATVNSSPDLKRGFCPGCGTTIFSLRDFAGIIGITSWLCSDDPSMFKPQMHIWTASETALGDNSMTDWRR